MSRRFQKVQRLTAVRNVTSPYLFTFASAEDEWNVRIVKKKGKFNNGVVQIVPAIEQDGKRKPNYYWYINCSDPVRFKSVIGTLLSASALYITKEILVNCYLESVAAATVGASTAAGAGLTAGKVGGVAEFVGTAVEVVTGKQRSAGGDIVVVAFAQNGAAYEDAAPSVGGGAAAKPASGKRKSGGGSSSSSKGGQLELQEQRRSLPPAESAESLTSPSLPEFQESSQPIYSPESPAPAFSDASEAHPLSAVATASAGSSQAMYKLARVGSTPLLPANAAATVAAAADPKVRAAMAAAPSNRARQKVSMGRMHSHGGGGGGGGSASSAEPGASATASSSAEPPSNKSTIICDRCDSRFFKQDASGTTKL